MNHIAAVVCERSGQWAVALRRHLRGSRLRLVETRTLTDCRDSLTGAPGAMPVCELTEKNVEAVLRFLVELQTAATPVRAVIVAGREMASQEWLVREAGAVHAVFSPRQIATVAALVRRHAALLPEQETSLHEAAWSRLPWGE